MTVESVQVVCTILTLLSTLALLYCTWQYVALTRSMATTMAAWNGYTPEPTHELYIASGDTTDWAYGALGIFAFTFEMSPNGGGFGGDGFYPGPTEIQHSFQANLKPALYLIDLADDPHRAVTAPQTTLFYGR